MSIINPVGIDMTSGQLRSLNQNDILTTSSKFCDAYFSDSPSILSQDAFTTLSFNVEAYNTVGTALHSTTVNPSRFIAPFPGIYYVIATVYWPVNSSGIRSMQFLVSNSGGTPIGGVEPNLINPTSGGTVTIQTAPWAFPLNVGDYVQLQVKQTSGSTLSMVAAGSRFMFMYIMPK